MTNATDFMDEFMEKINSITLKDFLDCDEKFIRDIVDKMSNH